MSRARLVDGTMRKVLAVEKMIAAPPMRSSMPTAVGRYCDAPRVSTMVSDAARSMPPPAAWKVGSFQKMPAPNTATQARAVSTTMTPAIMPMTALRAEAPSFADMNFW